VKTLKTIGWSALPGKKTQSIMAKTQLAIKKNDGRKYLQNKTLGPQARKRWTQWEAKRPGPAHHDARWNDLRKKEKNVQVVGQPEKTKSQSPNGSGGAV